MSFDSEFLQNLNNKSLSKLEKRVSSLYEILSDIMVKLVEITEYCDDQFTSINLKLEDLTIRLGQLEDNYEHSSKSAQKQEITQKLPKKSNDTNLKPPPLIAKPPIPTPKKSKTSLRMDIISELKEQFKLMRGKSTH